MKKKITAVFLMAALTVSMAGCGTKTEETKETESETTETVAVETEEAEELISGGWNQAESPEITEDIQALVKAATEDMDGVSYEPVAYVAGQVVAGTNHLILCEETDGTEEAKYALVTIFEALDGSAEITDVQESDVSVPGSEGDGAWTMPDSTVVTEEAAAALENAAENMTGADYSALALLGTQVVAGTNYLMLCCCKTVTAEPETSYELVYVYEDTEGNAQITDVLDFSEGAE